MSPSPPNPAASFIASHADLAAACGRWSTAGVIGVDTEFVRERTYYPIPALIQVTDGDGVALVDPLSFSDFAPLAGLLRDRSVVKVMHAWGEDLEVLERLTGDTPRGVFDTQLAGAFAGHGYSLGYRALVKELTHVELDKGETRSKWLRRPLSPAQRRYAALDVAYLLPMHRQLSRELVACGRVAWFEEESEHQRRARAVDKLPEVAYLKVRRRGALSPSLHAVLRGLARWRETEAMARDIPRRHLLSDEVMMALAKASPADATALRRVRGLSERAAARYEQSLLATIETARGQGPVALDALLNLRLHAGTLDRFRQVVRRVADALRLPPELLASRRGLEALLVSVLGNDDIPGEFQGWRFDVVTKQLLDGMQTPI